ncbi:uncharacterized protein M421DRAFT_218290 [Didymella exigua CBS 183.55]|uniref:Uncharacterized protein n=1 Tax=Didymella exigua CBS 183.55 TaxID=1150837 RepID=A0A6A5RD39_9PLEO|nr:uncharacterized protein M421DRAFT_218290 [Didymella exigua CBS 183.55]KAF1926171.1 hypothetical protein M421DRAFT_218290 [Didymella exigua CBS 183.55]
MPRSSTFFPRYLAVRGSTPFLARADSSTPPHVRWRLELPAQWHTAHQRRTKSSRRRRDPPLHLNTACVRGVVERGVKRRSLPCVTLGGISNECGPVSRCRVTFELCTTMHARWRHARWRNTHWRNTHWRNAHWRNAHWRHTRWRNAHWRNAHWRNAHWRYAHWRHAHWRHTHWRNAH